MHFWRSKISHGPKFYFSLESYICKLWPKILRSANVLFSTQKFYLRTFALSKSTKVREKNFWPNIYLKTLANKFLLAKVRFSTPTNAPHVPCRAREERAARTHLSRCRFRSCSALQLKPWMLGKYVSYCTILLCIDVQLCYEYWSFIDEHCFNCTKIVCFFF